MHQLRKTEKTFLSRPSDNDVLAFKSHVKKTGEPESFYRITNSYPASYDDAEIIAEFSVSRDQRVDKSMAPCPICSPRSPKFLQGYLVWFPREVCIRAIGQECGGNVDPNWNKRRNAFKKLQKQRKREDFLFENLHTVPKMAASVEERYLVAKEHRRIWSQLRRRCGPITSYLRKSMARGQIMVTEYRRTDSPFIEPSTSPHFLRTIGSVTGQTAVKSNFSHDKQAKTTLEALDLINHGDDPNSVGLIICEMTVADTVQVEKVIKNAKKTNRKIRLP